MTLWSPRFRWATVLLHLTLIGMMAVTADSALGWCATGLLALAVPGLVRGRLRTYGWASMLVAFYSALWLANGYAAGPERALSLWVATVAALDFSAIVLFARFRRREPPAPTERTAA
ncbi:DUF2069 domain-containing protein [Flagellatimonas centrodinii]|uniref:DUF2069 domain-containing protein n=1 Tax=Flagellatimonas centrodinii TaxID=2806210 RepID=UPI001FEDD789|nr:DUF2069 domain-containing protein [Flagellatimonas centrodinii]ULQ45592.1 DUF2069 domain-containing protein [Flagellatimonas centrodinii]